MFVAELVEALPAHSTVQSDACWPGAMRRQSEPVQTAADTDRGSLLRSGWRQKVRSGITPRTLAIDATHNIDHLTRRALVRVEVGHVRGQDGLPTN